jgi:hypothetical protein
MTAASPVCPVCAGRGEAFLSLPAQPIYQHPVPADAVVAKPHEFDLSWSACVNCAHGITLASAIGREPDIWTDGNPNKVGKKFVGSTRLIVTAESAIAAAESPEFTNPAFVITSAFQNEIFPRVRQSGWNGPLFDSSGTRL